MAFAKIVKGFMDEPYNWPADWSMDGLTLPQLEVMLSATGKIDKSQALDIINERRIAKGLEPLDGIP
jgi:hypothetical protein